jgi:Na+/H+ antiporter NhaD/arsenite permease-like protein
VRFSSRIDSASRKGWRGFLGFDFVFDRWSGGGSAGQMEAQKMRGAIPRQTSDGSLLISYLTLRALIGAFGLLPLLVPLIAKCGPDGSWQQSLSAYYHTTARDVLVGPLFVVGLFLISYKGFDRLDTRSSSLAGVAALFVAVFPCSRDQHPNAAVRLGAFQWPETVSNDIHVVSAAVLFLTLAFISRCLFTKTDPKLSMTREKKWRNVVYRWSAVFMVGAIVWMAFWHIYLHGNVSSIRPTFIGETVALVAFGFSWLTKGEALALLRDKSPKQRATAGTNNP